MRSRLVFLAIILFACSPPTTASAQSTVTLAWDPNTEPDIAGYVLLYGTTPGIYDHDIDVGPRTTYAFVPPVPGTTYYFSVQAYNAAGIRSDLATPVAATIPDSRPAMSIDTPAAASTVRRDLVVAGWALDLGSTTNSGVDAVHAWAWPNPGSGALPVFLGAAQLGLSRPDVGNAFGPQFATSGYHLSVAGLPTGAYDVVVFMRSRIAGEFNKAQKIRITVADCVSRPMMAVDTPSNGATVPRTFVVSGWAIDFDALSGPGVDAVHVWAFPASGGAPVFVGATTTGAGRDDLAAAFGEQFRTGAYYLWGTLPAGSYTLVAYARSTVAQSFNNALAVRITVR